MLTRIRQWLAPPVFPNDEARTNTAAVLNAVALVVCVAVILFVAGNFIFGKPLSGLLLTICTSLIVVGIGTLILMRFGYVQPTGVVLLLVFWLGFTVPMIRYGGLHDSSLTGYFVLIILAGVTLGGPALLLFGLLCVVSLIGIFIAENYGLIEPSVYVPTQFIDLILIVLAMIVAGVLLQYAVRRMRNAYRQSWRDARAVEERNAELQSSHQALAVQTGKLERHTRYLESTAKVVREASLVLDLSQLLPRIVMLIAEQLEVYRIGVFLVDAAKEWAVLQATAGKKGQVASTQGFRIRVDGPGIVAHVIRSGQLYFAADVAHDPLYLPVEAVADTQSELTLPLRVRGEVLGALSVQSPELDAFDDDDIVAMQALADQAALAVSNAQLFQQVKESLEAERRAYGQLSREAWQELGRSQSYLHVLRDREGIAPAGTALDSEVEKALKTGRPTVDPQGQAKVAVPIRVRGQVIGAIDAHKPEEAGEWKPEQIALLETLSSQLSDALENARLYSSAQERAIRERLFGEVTARMRQTLDLDNVLQTAAREMREVLDLAEAEVWLEVE